MALFSSADMPLLLPDRFTSAGRRVLRLKSSEEGIPLDLPEVLRRGGVRMFHQLRRRIAVHLHPVMVGEFTKEYVPGFANVHRMLHETLRVLISFEHLKLGSIGADKPVIAQRFCVLLLGLPDHF